MNEEKILNGTEEAIENTAAEAANPEKPEKNPRGQNRTIEEKLLWQLHKSGNFFRYQTEGRGGQRRALAAIAHEEGISQRELMERLEVKAGSLSEILGKLEERGCIRRRKNEEDRRNYNLFLTEAGRAALEELNARHRESAEGLFAALEEEEKQQLSALLKKLLLSLKEQKAEQEAEKEERGGREHRKKDGCGKHAHGEKHWEAHSHKAGKHGGHYEAKAYGNRERGEEEREEL